MKKKVLAGILTFALLSLVMLGVRAGTYSLAEEAEAQAEVGAETEAQAGGGAETEAQAEVEAVTEAQASEGAETEAQAEVEAETETQIEAEPLAEEADYTVPVPYGCKIQSIDQYGITFYWKRPDRCDGYQVFRAYKRDGKYEMIADINTSDAFTYADNTFNHEKNKVYYKVRAYMVKDGKTYYSDYSESKCAKRITEYQLNIKTVYMRLDATRQLSCFFDWGERVEAHWQSSDPEVATVNSNGLVTGLKRGNCIITCYPVMMVSVVDSDGKPSGEYIPTLGTPIKCKIHVDRRREITFPELKLQYHKDADGIWRSDKTKSGQSEGQTAGQTAGKPDSEGPDEATLMIVGDLMCTGAQQSAVQQGENYDFTGSFKYVKDIISSADLALGNFETTVSSAWPTMHEESYIDGRPNCNAPEQFVYAVADAGFDGVTFANNHAADAGLEGLFDTIRELDRFGLANTGAFTDKDQERYMIFDVNGIKVGVVAYNATSYNSKEDEWTEEEVETYLNYYSKAKAKADIEAVRKAGAEFVIACMHWGTKNVTTVRSNMERIAKELANLGVDYIAGAHPHMPAFYEVITSKSGKAVPCIYSLGNFVSSVEQVEGNRDTIILRIQLVRLEDGSIYIKRDDYIPCYIRTKFEKIKYITVPLFPELIDGIRIGNIKEKRLRLKAALGGSIFRWDE